MTDDLVKQLRDGSAWRNYKTDGSQPFGSKQTVEQTEEGYEMTDDLVKRLREQSSEMSRADYWEAQASMWHENYKEAMAHEEEARRYKVALERIRDSGYGTKERIRQIIKKALGEKKDD